jgi:hypothetical protein
MNIKIQDLVLVQKNISDKEIKKLKKDGKLDIIKHSITRGI